MFSKFVFNYKNLGALKRSHNFNFPNFQLDISFRLCVDCLKKNVGKVGIGNVL